MYATGISEEVGFLPSFLAVASKFVSRIASYAPDLININNFV